MTQSGHLETAAQADSDHVINDEPRKMPREPSMASYVECEKN